ncbi:MAG: DHBP synthase RibB-like alpha/beta domain-containing protein [Monoraphidium minutum]|nr:MAG: DHBP synthase RibB-like alpha/beta domain-containing protein [Monoraphidium minutum]
MAPDGAAAAAAAAPAPPAARHLNSDQQQQQHPHADHPQRNGGGGGEWGFDTRMLRVDPAVLEAAGAGRGGAARYALPEDPPGGGGDSGGLAAALAALREAGRLLRDGQLVALPTETVYGLAASALDAAAVRRIFAAKGRPADNPLIVHVSDLDMLRSLYPGEADPIPPVYAAAVAAHWPGPLTILLPASPLVPRSVTAGHATMAVRMPSHPVARAAIAAAGVPLAAPSANSSGRPSPTAAGHVIADLSGRLPLVLDGGPCGCGVESTVLDGLRSPPAVLRPGGVPAEALAALPGLAGLAVYAREFVDAALEAAPTTPGMKYRHYSPAVPVTLVEPPAAAAGGGAETEEVRARAAAALAAAAAAAAGALRAGGRPRVALLRTTLPEGTPAGWVAAAGGGWRQAGGPAAGALDGSGGGGGEEREGSGGGGVEQYCLGPLAAPSEVARRLFAGLRDAEAAGASAIVVEGVAEGGEGLAVMNRLRKAASEVVRAEAAAPGELGGGCGEGRP